MRCGQAATLPRASRHSARSENPVMNDRPRPKPSPRPASRTLGELVDEMAAATPNAEAVVFRDERLDYAGLKTRTDVFARALLAVGVRHGDRVALLITNRTEWIISAFAAAKI